MQLTIDIHHIFPQEWCKTHGIDPKRCDSIVNKTMLSAKTNRIIGGNAPGEYLVRIQKSAGITEERMDEILRSHLIDSAFLRANDFEAFFQAREQALLQRIEKAMGKAVIREAASIEEPATVMYAEGEETDE